MVVVCTLVHLEIFEILLPFFDMKISDINVQSITRNKNTTF